MDASALIGLASAVVGTPLLVGAGALGIFGRAKASATRTTRALVFHSVSPGSMFGYSHFSPEKFRQVLDVLKREGPSPITMDEALSRTSSTASVCLTFDDGFDDFYANALPILSEVGARVTVFPVAGFLDMRSTWDALAPRMHLSGEHLREISALGHQIGSHSLTHADLTRLGPTDLTRELSESRKLIEDLTGKPVTALSFPFGRWNARAWETARSLGYTTATVYAGHGRAVGVAGLVPTVGVYAFDTPGDVLGKLRPTGTLTNARARARVMPHFAKGTWLWRSRREYRV